MHIQNTKIKNCSFHHVSLNVKNYDKSVAFYKALGMEIYIEWITDSGKEKGKHCFIDVGDGPYLELHSSSETDLHESRMQHICFYVDDVDAAYQAALENGASTKMVPQNFPLRGKSKTIESRFCHVYGIDGESIEFITWKGYDPKNYKKLPGM